jgi:excisionase family DNA binding protein
VTPAEPLRDASAAPYLTPRQLAALLQVSEKTVYRWVSDDRYARPSRIPALTIGGVVRFHRERVLAWLRDRERDRRAKREPRAAKLRSGARQPRVLTALASPAEAVCAAPCAENGAERPA